MTYVNAGSVRTGLVGLVVMVAMTAGYSSDAAAKHKTQVVQNAQAPVIQTASVQETRPTVMRYYGGPKSPMWSSQ